MLGRLRCSASTLGRGVAACGPALSSASVPIRCFAAADKSGGGSGFVRTEAGLQDLYMRALEPKPVPVPKMSPEELEKNKEMAILYSKLRKKRHVRLERDIKRKLDLKWAAFHCLPSLERKKEALQINPFVPLYRKVATALPPIHGFGGPAGADAGADALAAGAGSSASAASAAAAGSAAPAKAGAGAGSAAPAAGASAGAAGKGKPGAAAAGGAGAPAGAAAGAGKEAPKKPANVNAESLLNRRSGQSDDSELLGMSSAPVAAPAAPAKKEAAPAPEVGKKKKK